MATRTCLTSLRIAAVTMVLGATLSASTLLAQSDGGTGGTGTGTGTTTTTTYADNDRDDNDGFDLGWLGLLGLAGLAGLKKNDRDVHTDTTNRPRA